MKQVPNLRIPGKKMTAEAMKKIQGGLDPDVLGISYWHCGLSCYVLESECRRVCDWTICEPRGKCAVLVEEDPSQPGGGVD